MKISTLNNLDGDVWHMILDNLYVAGEQKREQSTSTRDTEETPAQPREASQRRHFVTTLSRDG